MREALVRRFEAWRAVVAVVATLWLVVGSGGPAAAAAGPKWRMVLTAEPTGAISSSLVGVSCFTTTVCVSVGQFIDRPGRLLGFADVRNGATWTAERLPVPSGGSRIALWNVSCGSVTFCIAVGSYDNRRGVQLPLAEAWNGTTWSVQKPTRRGYTSLLHGVSCPSATACTAVGEYVDRRGRRAGLVEAWNGTTWAVHPTPTPPDATDLALSGVSCLSSTACTAVGAYDSASQRAWVPLAEVWNGATWAVETVPHRRAESFGWLGSVSCSSATACQAVGTYIVAHRYRNLSLAESWNGTTWIERATPASADGGFLSGVSCTSSMDCTAVGYRFNNAGGVQRPIADAWNGAAWAEQTTPILPGSLSGFSAASCSTPSACTAVGFHTPNSPTATRSLVEAEHG